MFNGKYKLPNGTIVVKQWNVSRQDKVSLKLLQQQVYQGVTSLLKEDEEGRSAVRKYAVGEPSYLKRSDMFFYWGKQADVLRLVRFLQTMLNYRHSSIRENHLSAIK